MLTNLFKRKTMEENTSKAIRIYNNEGPYEKDAMQVAIRGRLGDSFNSPKSFEEIIVNSCGLHNNTHLQWAAYGCMLKFIDEGFVKVTEVEGRKMYSFTELGANEGSWPLSVESLAKIILDHYRSEEKKERDDSPWAYSLYSSKRDF